MGLVFEATHLILRQRVALKVLHPERRDVAGAAERFLREARATSRLRTQYVARVFDMGTTATGLVYMAMEFLEGEDLLQRLDRVGALGVSEAIGYVLQACEGLAEAHGAGLVHRDIKPSNLFRSRGLDGTTSIKLLDFGVSKMRGPQDSVITKDTALLGSPVYMAPEQLMSARDVDARADIWSLGVVLYELLTGVLPFAATSLPVLSAAISRQTPDPPSRLRPDVPAALDAVILQCLRKTPDERWPDVAALARALSPWAPTNLQGSADRCARILDRAQPEEPDATTVPTLESWPATAYTAGDESSTSWPLQASRKVALAAAVAGALFCAATLGWIQELGSLPPSAKPSLSAPSAAAVRRPTLRAVTPSALPAGRPVADATPPSPALPGSPEPTTVLPSFAPRPPELAPAPGPNPDTSSLGVSPAATTAGTSPPARTSPTDGITPTEDTAHGAPLQRHRHLDPSPYDEQGPQSDGAPRLR